MSYPIGGYRIGKSLRYVFLARLALRRLGADSAARLPHIALAGAESSSGTFVSAGEFDIIRLPAAADDERPTAPE